MGLNAEFVVKFSTPKDSSNLQVLLRQRFGKGVTVFEEDKKTVSIDPGQRYYGPGYERGDAPLLFAFIEYLWYLDRDAEITYQDDTGAPGDLLNLNSFQQLKEHFYKYGHEPYLAQFGSLSVGSRPICPECHTDMHVRSFSVLDTVYECSSCDYVETEERVD